MAKKPGKSADKRKNPVDPRLASARDELISQTRELEVHVQSWTAALDLYSLIRGQWLPSQLTSEERRFLVPLCIGLYVDATTNRVVSMKEACDHMRTDASITGPKYIRLAEKIGLLKFDFLSTDKRKRYIRPTSQLMALLSSEFVELGKSILLQRDML